MLPLHFARTWAVTGTLILLLSLAVALVPVPAVAPLNLNDKLIHATAFTGFMVWYSGLFEARFAPAIAVGLSAYGLLIEMLQSFTPTRQAEALDVVADVAGVLLGWLLASAGLRRWCQVLESWFVRPKTRP